MAKNFRYQLLVFMTLLLLSKENSISRFNVAGVPTILLIGMFISFKGLHGNLLSRADA